MKLYPQLPVMLPSRFNGLGFVLYTLSKGKPPQQPPILVWKPKNNPDNEFKIYTTTEVPEAIRDTLTVPQRPRTRYLEAEREFARNNVGGAVLFSGVVLAIAVGILLAEMGDA